MGSSPKSSSTTQSLPAWLRPHAQEFISEYRDTAFDVDPTTGQYTLKPADPGLQQQVEGFTPEQYLGMQNVLGASQGAGALAGMGAQQNALTMGGAYLSPETNPYLGATYDAAARRMTDAYSTATAPSIIAAAQRSGQFGSSGMDESMALSRYDLGENLGNLATSIYGGNYQQERARQMQALGMNPQVQESLYNPGYAQLGIGTLQQQQGQSELDTNYMNAVQRSEYPYQILSGFGGALGQAAGGAGSSTTKSSGGGMFGK